METNGTAQYVKLLPAPAARRKPSRAMRQHYRQQIMETIDPRWRKRFPFLDTAWEHYYNDPQRIGEIIRAAGECGIDLDLTL